MTTTADQILASLAKLPAADLREVLQRAPKEILPQIEAAAAESAKKVRLSRIAAARDSRDADFLLSQGILTRANINVEDVTDSKTFDKLCAASHRPPSAENKMVVKSALFRLGVMAD
jgi:hypothetical protein